MTAKMLLRWFSTAAIASLIWAIPHVGNTMATPQAVQAEIKKLVGSGTAKSGKVTFDMADMSEDGANVLMGLHVDSPMTETDYVKTVYVFAELNPNPRVAAFHFSPLAGKAEVVTRIRLAKSQKIIALAEMNDGSFYITEKWINITIGGCGGGN
jgi:sulfur-oxidizing protein SoxY